MLTILYGTDWVKNTDTVLQMLSQDVAQQKGNRVFIVPELISHDMERSLCSCAGDCASRYAEVLSFTRLARRVADSVGHAAPECLDNGGRVVAMASAARQLHSKLKAYASVETRPEFLSGLVDVVDEFKRCCITASDLLHASKQTEGSLAQKLEELALIMEAYDSLCLRGKRDPRDQMNWLLEQLEDSDFAQEHVFYIDGFPDFTRQHMQILSHIICNSHNVVISLNCDRVGSSAPGFERAGETASDVLRMAKQYGIPVQLQQISDQESSLSVVKKNLFRGEIVVDDSLKDRLFVCQADNTYNETIAAAERIMNLVQSGSRYRDISVVCPNMSDYKSTIDLVFNRCKIPFYQSGTEDVLQKNVTKTVLFALDAALGGLEQQDVLCYMKSMLSPLDITQADELENYAVVWSVTGNGWKKEWKNHPEGLNGHWTETVEQDLSRLNRFRELLILPLEKLQSDFNQANNLRQQVQAVYSFFDEIQLARRLSDYALQMDEKGDNRSAQVLNQIWEILLNALEQMHDVLGQTIWNADTFVHLFKLVLSQYDVGTIPATLDAVMVGPVNAMRCQRSRHLVVLGALEGALPSYGVGGSVLSEQERTTLRKLGVPLNGGSMDGLLSEFAEIYGVFCGAQETIAVFCPDGQPSFVFKRLQQMSGEENRFSSPMGAVFADAFEAGALASRYQDLHAAEQIGVVSEFQQIQKKKEHTLGDVSAEGVHSLYGNRLNLSASQVDRLAECRLSYFLKYGVRVAERKPAQIDPAEFGTYVHAVLEQTGREVMELGGFQEVSMNQTIQIARRYSDLYIREHFSQIDTQRLSYLFRRNAQELELIVEELWRELYNSEFKPSEFELSFGDDGQMSAVRIENQHMDAFLRGFVDRVDIWEREGQTYFRVVDYKTGKKSFDYCDVFNGIGLQMLIYMFALEQAGQDVLGSDLIPAGVQYFPARVPLISTDGVPNEEEVEKARATLWKRNGLLLGQEDVLEAMEHDVLISRLSYGKTKDGALKGDLASLGQLELLKKYVFMLLSDMIQQIVSGNVTANPYTRGSSHNACSYCPYDCICHSAEVTQRRNYQKMDAAKFWDEVEKEVGRNGR